MTELDAKIHLTKLRGFDYDVFGEKSNDTIILLVYVNEYIVRKYTFTKDKKFINIEVIVAH